MKKTRAARGFTLPEVLVTIAIDGLIMTAVSALLITLLQQSDIRYMAFNSADQVRKTGKTFVNEIRNAQAGNDGSYAIGQASTTQVIFFTSYHTPSATIIDRIRYFVASSTLYEGVTVPTGSPLVYNLGSEVVTPVITNLVATTTPIFSYYSGSYAGTSSPLSFPVNVTQVTFVGMSLSVWQQNSQTASTTFKFQTGGAIRSLKTNLGN